ncbi:MAG TPA: hypothetical protein DCL52_05925 [Flavobacteriaceae bacterium]|nr:DUF4476 domain-containing protein [Ulvibacter sp.]HAH34307.1 hypothetical protein [Flavobacteriaceae bacterium]
MKITLSILLFVLTLSISAQTIMTQTTTTNTPANNGVNINMNMGEGTSIKMNMGNTQQQTTTQTTIITNRAPQTAVVYVTGYSGKVGCTPPVSEQRFNQMINSVKNQSFSDDKQRVTKQIVKSNCMTVDQLVDLLNEFSFDDGKLDTAKFAYNYIYDVENYFKVFDVFSFSSSGEELEQYINDRN